VLRLVFANHAWVRILYLIVPVEFTTPSPNFWNIFFPPNASN